ncbi:MAG: helix-turn-helix transcriptional regulator [Clostridia bacterium]|nr:helix-turn-helix transcriptional regulator [Clostridia bacterium]
MLYQTLLMGDRPYYVACNSFENGFEEHRHPEIELHYCIQGEYITKINKTEYKVAAGDMAVIGSMTSHELPANQYGCRVLVIEVGPMLLSDYFDALSQKTISNPILHLKNDSLTALLNETAKFRLSPTDFSELQIRGNLFKICGHLLSEIANDQQTDHTSKALRSVASIETALETIYTRYSENIDIETVATLCGYSKSNFCKIFKNITGDTFHNLLNSHRIKIACNLISETTNSIEEIAFKTGFPDSKSFCRVFKNINNVSPGQYRKQKKN